MRCLTAVTIALVLGACSGDDDGRSSSGGGGGAGDDGATDGDDGQDGEKLDVAEGTGGGPGDEDDEDCEEDVDIVFVMDVSTSMGGYLSKLADEIVAVDTAIAALGVPGERRYGLVVFVDDTMILNEGAPYADVLQLQADFNTWSAFTQSNEQIGGGNLNTTWPENSLDALYLGASVFQWRPMDETLRAVIHATDDTFWDGPTVGNGVQIEHGYDETVSILQEHEVRVFTFAAHIGGPLSDQDVTPGWYGPYQGKDSIPDATGGGVFDIDLVLAGQISLSEGIVGAIEENLCEEYPPAG
jgi:hypothetical protein